LSLNRIVLTALAILAVLLAIPAVASAKKARFVVDRATAEKIGRAGITPDVRPSSNLVLGNDGKAVAKFKVKGGGSGKIRLGGSFRFSKGSTVVSVRKLVVKDGKKLTGVAGGNRFTALKLNGRKFSGNKIRFSGAVLGDDMARALRGAFNTGVFKSGMRFFTKGAIPR